jgi:hypothetical protein
MLIAGDCSILLGNISKFCLSLIPPQSHCTKLLGPVGETPLNLTVFVSENVENPSENP